MADVVFNRTLPENGREQARPSVPIQNSDTVIYESAKPPGTPVTNEEVKFISSPTMETNPDKVILKNEEPRPAALPLPPPAIEERRAPNPINTGTEVTFIPGPGPVLNISNDVTMGKSADPTKPVRSDEVTFLGKNAFSVGSTEVVQAPSGDTTKLAGTEDVMMIPGEVLPSHEVVKGAVGTPITNEIEETKLGARGRPRNVSK